MDHEAESRVIPTSHQRAQGFDETLDQCWHEIRVEREAQDGAFGVRKSLDKLFSLPEVDQVMRLARFAKTAGDLPQEDGGVAFCARAASR